MGSMSHLKSIIILISLIGIVFYFPVTGSSFMISDDQVRNLNVSPMLGRGYSVGTNSFQSTCLKVNETISPSYNYDYVFTDFTRSKDIEVELSGKLAKSFGYSEIKTEISMESKRNSNFGTENADTFIVVGTMRIERYYSTIKEESSPMLKDAEALLDDQDYIGFFKFCGTNFIRSIRRAQEITTIFKFQSVSMNMAQEFADGLKLKGVGSTINNSFDSRSKHLSSFDSLEIKILGYGLGLNHEGSSALVSTSLDQYSNVMDFAFKSFTQAEDNGNVGMIYALEVLPWVDNTAFQSTSKFLDEDIVLPLQRSLIPKARAIYHDYTGGFENTIVTRLEFECKNSLYHMDKYGYCCDKKDLFNKAKEQYEKEELDIAISNRSCRPNSKLDKSAIRNNMSNNGEFITRLDTVIRHRTHQLLSLEKCVASVNSFPERFDYYILKSQDSVKYDAKIESNFTVKELKMALDPLNDYSLVKHMGKELDEFIEMFYEPCIAALFGANIGFSPDTEPKYFMAYGWMSHNACSKLSCLNDNTRWNRDGSGCIASIITGSKAPLYDSTSDEECKKDDEVNSDDEFEVCKYKSADLEIFQNDVNSCWGTQTVPYYLMEHFCMPEITGAIVSEDIQVELEHKASQCIRS